MVAFSSKGRREYDLFMSRGDPEVIKVAGTGPVHALDQKIFDALPTEQTANEIHLEIIEAMNSGIEVSQNPTLRSLLDALERQYPIINDVVERNLHVMLSDVHGYLSDLLSTYCSLRDRQNVGTDSE